jgi:hypothetical protein
MTTQTLIRIGSFALIAAGVLGIGYGLIAPDETAAGVFQQPTYVLGNTLNALRWILVTFGLVALYLRQGDRSRTLNLAAFLVAFVAMILTVGLDIDKTFILPYLASVNPSITSVANFAQNMPALLQPYLMILMLGLLLHLVGPILLGAAIVRSGVFPALAGWLIILANVLSYGNLFGVNILHVIGVLGVGVADIWLGLALRERQTSAETTSAMQVQSAK